MSRLHRTGTGQDGDLLLALVGIGLGNRLGQLHLKLVAAQRHLLVVRDERKQRVEHQVVRQIELGAARLLPGVDPAVLDTPGAPGSGRGKTATCSPKLDRFNIAPSIQSLFSHIF